MFRTTQIPEDNGQGLMQWKPPSLGGGICLKDLEQNLLDDQSPRLLNVWYLNQVLSKRYGQAWTIGSNLASKPILSVCPVRYKTYIIIVCDTKMYKVNTSTGVATQIYASLTTGLKGSFFVTGENLYYINAKEYVMYNGTTVTTVTPYIPTTFTACPPSGGGTALEEENRLGAGQTNKFSGTTGTTAYTLSKQGLDATTVTALVNGVVKVETTDFTVNRTTGVVTFNVAPGVGTNNVEITFYKTNTTIINAFLACKYTTLYGDAKETVFFGGNALGDIYWSDVNLPNYIPLSNTKKMGDSGDDVTGFGIQYDTLCIFKPRTIYSANKVTSDLVSFSFAIVNDSIGCDMPYTIQLINNRLTWCNSYGGVYTLTSTLIKDERNVKPLSDNVNGTQFRPGLFNESLTDLQAATSCDWTKYNQYWLCVGTKVYMWDYGLRPYIDSGDFSADQKRLSWWMFDNINANCFFVDGDDMYYGDRTVGNLSHMVEQLNDFGSAITARYRIPLRDFGASDWLKNVPLMTITSRADTNCKINIEYITEHGSRIDPQPITLTSFSWANFSWATFSWSVINFGKSITRYPSNKHVLYWSVEFSNSDVARDLSIIGLVVFWSISKKIR